MVAGGKVDMISGVNSRMNLEDIMIGEANGMLEDSIERELESMLRVQRYRNMIDGERDLDIYRSGSAPPTVEGSFNAVGSLFRNPNSVSHTQESSNNNGFLSEDEIRSHPAYLSYYYSNDNLNPRLPPPLLSKEDWRVAQRFQSAGSSFDGRWASGKKNTFENGDNTSLFSVQPEFSLQQQVEDELMELRKATAINNSRQSSREWLDRGSHGSVATSGAGLGSRRKSFADIVQEGLDQPTPLSGRISRPASRNALGDPVDITGYSNSHPAELFNGMKSREALHSGTTASGMPRVQSLGSIGSHSVTSALGSSVSRSRTPDPQMVVRSPSPGLFPGCISVCPVEKKNALGSNILNNSLSLSSSMSEISDIAASFSGLNLQNNRLVNENAESRLALDLEKQLNHLYDMSVSQKQNLHQQLVKNIIAEKTSANFKLNPPGFATMGGSNSHYQMDSTSRVYNSGHEHSGYSASMDFSTDATTGYSGQKLQSAINDHLDAGSTLTSNGNGQSFSRSGNNAGTNFHSTVADPHYSQYRTSDTIMRSAARIGNSSKGKNYSYSSHEDLQELQKAYIESLLPSQKQHYELPLLGKNGGLNHAQFVTPTLGLGVPYSGNPLAKSVFTSIEPGNPMLQNEGNSHFTSMLRSPIGGSAKQWDSIGTNLEGRPPSSLLEELKNNKSRSFELSDIIDHVVEFSTDQFGSRFIQQKLETATVEEKMKIFPEIMPHARTLMTDVFGNYVIQKFFEHGTESQRIELARQLTGHVLPLSLQMYGCRVIQKALEVVDVDQQTQMVMELDGSVMKCVRDQNGNHVIQKCIECVPQDRIQFIISAFFGQVVALSTHPYGCRVIQRVLEHCDDLNSQNIIMDEILQSVCALAQDQYGNYVIQHVLQHGKPHERKVIICKLAGQIVKMSQEKFASNVVEKCLTFGGPEERQLLVNEMLGSTDENEPLQAMMKDPFGNYVVQKVLETCDDQSRELILSRIKVHLSTLKRFTYGKHIVSRVEKLIRAGERRSGLSASYSS